jgi:hypothetical protein
LKWFGVVAFSFLPGKCSALQVVYGMFSGLKSGRSWKPRPPSTVLARVVFLRVLSSTYSG